jgi:3-hydroxyacyl-CoA dehydrogenase
MSKVVSLEQVGDVAVVRLANPPVNAIGQAIRAGLLDALEKAFASDAAAIVIAGDGRGFSGGADISEFGGALAGPDLNLIIERCEASAKPVVAAIHGIALGGGLELALGCSHRIANPQAQLGLPETKLGIIPGAGGTQRLPRLIGVVAAVEMIASGAPVKAQKALELGIIDAIVEGDIVEAGINFARSVAGRPVTPICDQTDKIEHTDPAVFAELRSKLARHNRNPMPSLSVIAAVEAACRLTFSEGLQEERRLFEECRASSQSRALVHTFFAERSVWKIPDVPVTTPNRLIRKVAVVGAGTMGTGIAMTFANAAIPVTLIDVDEASLARGLGRIRQNYASAVSKGRLTQSAMDEHVARFAPTNDLGQVADADIIIEAVFERLELKLEIFQTRCIREAWRNPRDQHVDARHQPNRC